MCKRVSSTLLQTQSDCPVKHDNAVDIDPRNMVSIIIIELNNYITYTAYLFGPS